MDLDFTYCNNLKLSICNKCKRNIHKYPDNTEQYLWYLTPVLKNNNCDNYVDYFVI